MGCWTLRFLETESVKVAARSLSEEESDESEESDSSELESWFNSSCWGTYTSASAAKEGILSNWKNLQVKVPESLRKRSSWKEGSIIGRCPPLAKGVHGRHPWPISVINCCCSRRLPTIPWIQAYWLLCRFLLPMLAPVFFRESQLACPTQERAFESMNGVMVCG